jgi:hypothetical protein
VTVKDSAVETGCALAPKFTLMGSGKKEMSGAAGGAGGGGCGPVAFLM